MIDGELELDDNSFLGIFQVYIFRGWDVVSRFSVFLDDKKRSYYSLSLEILYVVVVIVVVTLSTLQKKKRQNMDLSDFEAVAYTIAKVVAYAVTNAVAQAVA